MIFQGSPRPAALRGPEVMLVAGSAVLGMGTADGVGQDATSPARTTQHRAMLMDAWGGVTGGTRVSSLSPAPRAAGGLAWCRSRTQPTRLSWRVPAHACALRGARCSWKTHPPSWEGKGWIRLPQPGAKGAGWSTAQGQLGPYLGALYHSWVRVPAAALGTGTRRPHTASAAPAPAASAAEEESGRWVSQGTQRLIISFFQPVSCERTIKKSSPGVTHGVGTPRAIRAGSGG